MERLDLVPIGSMLLEASDFYGFDCEHQGINQFLQHQSVDLDRENRAKTFVLLDRLRIVGYYTLTVGNLEVEDLANQTLLRKPYVNLAYFAIDRDYQRQGYGHALMREVFQSVAVIGYYAGIELIYLESTDESVAFYEELGFELLDPRRRPEHFPVDTSHIEFPMIITLKTLQANGCLGYLHNFVPITVGE